MTLALVTAATMASSLEDARIGLASAFAADPVLSNTFPWAKAALEETTEKYVKKHLEANPPPLLTRPNISDHLRSLGYHLEQCLARQEKLFELESACISAVIDVLNADELLNIEEKLALSEYSFYAAAANGVDQASIGAAITRKFRIRRDLFTYRLKFFSAPGGPLNFEERIRFLRALQADSVASVYSRAHTIRQAMRCNGMATLDAPPAWGDGGSKVLEQLVHWSRTAIDKMDQYLSNELQAVIVIDSRVHGVFTDKDGLALNAEKIRLLLEAPGYDLMAFNLSKEFILSELSANVPANARLISASMGISFGGSAERIMNVMGDPALRDKEIALMNTLRDWRASKRISGRVIAPKQEANFPGEPPASWSVPYLYLDGEIPITETIDQADMAPLPGDRVGNINPIGKWTFYVNDVMRSPGVNGGVANDEWNDAYPWTQVQGVIFVLKLGWGG